MPIQLEIGTNPYRSDNRKTIFLTLGKHEIWQDAGSGRIIQIGSNEPMESETIGKLPIADLRRIATDLIDTLHPEQRINLHPLEDNKGRKIYFFRWDDFRPPVVETEVPPFFQVGLSPQGGLLSLIDVLTI